MSFYLRFARHAAAASLLAAAACKPPANTESSVKTIDSFAANQKIRVNQCRIAEDAVDSSGKFNAAKYGGKVLLKDRVSVQVSDAALKASLENEAMIALSAVPEFSQKLFAKMNAFIRITPDAGKICGVFLGDEKSPNYVDKSVRDTVESCNLLTDKGGNDRAMTLVINANVDSIRHGVVRGFGFLHAQFYPRLRREMGEAGNRLYTLDTEDTPAMLSLKDKLAREFFGDMIASEASNGVFKVQSLSHLLGKSLDSRSISDVLKANLAKADGELFAGLSLTYPGETKTLGQAQRDARSQSIRDFLVAESYDSLFCRPQGAYTAAKADAAKKPEDLAELTNTVKVFEKFFNKTYTAYTASVIPAMRTQSDEIMATIEGRPGADVVQSTPGNGFSLQGEGGLAAILQALTGANAAPLQPVSSNGISTLPQASSGPLFQPPVLNNANNGQVVANGAANGTCPCCGCKKPCNCQGGGCCGPNCPCNGGGGAMMAT